MSGPDGNASKADPLVTKGLVGVAAVGLLLAVLRPILKLELIDQTTLWLLGISAGALVLRDVKRLKWGDKELELYDGLRGDVDVLKSIAQQGPPPPEEAPEDPQTALQAAVEEDPLKGYDPRELGNDWGSDPNLGKFGGTAADGRELSAVVRPAGSKTSAACIVDFKVRSTDKAKPLEGPVWIYLHPTFGRWAKYRLQAKNGEAKDTITAWGAFTIGAVADRGKTRLELNLARIDGGTSRFYEA